MKRDLKIETVYPHPVEKVWRALTNPQALAQWLMRNDFEPRMGHKFQFRAKPRGGWDGIVNCEVIELEPPRRLAFTWVGSGLNSVVRFTLEPVAEGTRFRLEHTGFEGLKNVLLSFVMGSGWKSNMLHKRLPTLLGQWDGSGPVPEIPGSACNE